MGIENYIDVIITRETQGVSRATFDIPLILAPVSEFYERTRQYSSISAISDDFDTTDVVYLMAQKVFSQSPHPRIIKVGRKYANVNAKQTLTPDLAPTAGTFTITLGTETTAAIAYDANAAAIKAALELLTAITTVTVTGTMATAVVIEFTGADINKHFATMSVTETLTTTTSVAVTVQQYGSAVESYTTAINAIKNYDNAWYMLLADTRVKADVKEIAAVVQALRKIYMPKSEDTDVPTAVGTDVASELKAANYTRTALAFSEQTNHQFDCGFVGLMITKEPGTSTWAYKQLEGITSDEYTDSERAIILSKNANIFHEQAGVDITEQGRTAQGEWIDIIIGIDWIQARIEEECFGALVNVEKIPFTDTGIGVVVGIVSAVLNEAYKKGIVKDDYTVSAPLASEVSDTDKAARLLPDVTFSANMQGAIHFMEIRGTVSL